jgi:membrane protein YqaA with SNARE-associated domain
MKGRLAFLERWYEGIKRAARHKNAEPVLAGVSFVESSFFPIPPDVMLIPMVQAAPERAWRYALICTIASVLGGIVGYFIGMFFLDTLVRPMFDAIGKAEKLTDFLSKIEANPEGSSLVVLAAALTPFPYKVMTIGAGAGGVSLPAFIAASVLGRSLRFFLVAGIVKAAGPKAEEIMKEHFGWFSVGLFALLALMYWGYVSLMH